MTSGQSRDEWIFIETPSGPMRPGFRVIDSDVGDFAVISNSAGGVRAKDYSRQLVIILESLSRGSMKIIQIEVDSSMTSNLAIDQRILNLDYPIDMRTIVDHQELRRKISAAQKTVGQVLGGTGGNGNKRIQIHVMSTDLSATEFKNDLLNFKHTSNARVIRPSDLVDQIHTLTRGEILQAMSDWVRDGREIFFTKHKVNDAYKYLVVHDGNEFDAKALVVGALRIARPNLGEFKTSQFNGNAITIAEPLRRLGFQVLDIEIDKKELKDDKHERELRNRRLSGPRVIEQLVKARRGQGVFRANVESREPHCRVTGITNPRYLRASHIKPWRVSDDAEKIDGDNGLMLAPHIDHLFDQGLISFENNGTLIISKKADISVLEAWGVPMQLNVGPFGPHQCAYLEYHRKNVLKVRQIRGTLQE
jgi:hypothetical protein